MTSKREFTQSIVNNLKQKISEFKSKKQKDKMERKNELDFEINKDLVNQFKKNHSTNLAEYASEKKENSTNDIPKKEFKNDTSNRSFDYAATKIKIEKKNPNDNSMLDSSSKRGNLLNFDFNLDKIRKASTNINQAGNQNNNDLLKQIGYKGNFQRDVSGDTSIDKGRIESKKAEIMNTLFKKEPSNSSKYSFNNKKEINFNFKSNVSGSNSTKDKIKNFVYQLNDNKSTSGTSKIPKYNYNLSSKNEAYQPSFPSRPSYVSLGAYNTNKNKNSDSLASFADFSLESDKKTSDPFSSGKLRTFSSERLKVKPQTAGATKSIIDINDVRGLSSKIRFLSRDDIRNMDKNTIDELLSLANVIKRTFSENKFI